MDKFFLMLASCIVLGLGVVFPSTTGLQCFECLSIKCDSSTICESIKLSMARIFHPKRHLIEFNLNDTCPDQWSSNLNDTKWNQVSFECSKSDSVCLEATIEVITSYNGLNNSLKLDNFSTMKSLGVIRGCASRRFVLAQTEEYFDIKAEQVNYTLEAVTNSTRKPKDGYTITEIQSHHFYIDHGTSDAMKCYKDNCNRSKRFDKNSSNSVNSYNYLSVLVNLIFLLSYKS